MPRVPEMLLATVLALFLAAVAAAQPAPASEAMDLVKQARRLVTDGRLDEAVALYERAVAKAPDTFEAHLGAGFAYDLKLDFGRARKHLTRALELASEEQPRIQALNGLAVSYAFEGNATEAAVFYQKVYDAQMAAENFASAAGTANALGRVYLETGDVENARLWYQTGYEAARRQPASPASQLKLWEFRWIHAQGRMAAREGRHAEAARHTAAARALLAESPELKDEWPTWHYLAGYAALFAKDHQAAIDNLQLADPRDPFILALLAQAYEGAGNFARARETWQQVASSSAHSLQNAFARPMARKRVGR